MLVGVDGGQTSLRCLVSDTNGNCLAYTETQSHIEAANRFDREERLINCIRAALELADITSSMAISLWISMTGVPDRGSQPAESWRKAVAREFPDARVSVDSDILAALYGAAQLDPGVVALSGTGSIALGRNSDNRMARAGGWGYMVGDEGSGFHIGMSAIRAVTQAVDGLGRDTLLTGLLMSELDLDSPYDIKQYLYSQRPSPSSIAALSRVVAEAAANGDVASNRILTGAGRHMALLVYAVLRRLNLTDDPVNVYPVGGVLTHDKMVREGLRQELSRLAPCSSMTMPKLPPVAGSIMLAAEGGDQEVSDEFVERLSITLPDVPVMRMDTRRTWTLDSLKEHLKGKLIVSSQSTPPDLIDDPYVLTCLARSAIAGGAVAVRANGPNVIRQMRATFSEPILGISKIGREVNDVYITPTLEAAREIIDAGADFIAVDATIRPRPDGRSAAELISEIQSHYDIPIVADISTLDEAIAAEEMGVDFIATTLAGYTSYSVDSSAASLELVRDVSSAVSIPVLAEGKISSPEHAVACIRVGAWAVVVGSAITRPRLIAKRFAEALANI
ncbi:MAG: putative N-acetylmannosamine-6-phosphate 2-epimerase [Bacteroidales bacterium]